MAENGDNSGIQDYLFEIGPSDEVGYRGPIACQVAGITYRQLDYWARTKLVTPSVRDARGCGTQRLYSFRDILVLKIIKRLLDTGISLQNVRVAIEQLREFGVEDLSSITIVSDGSSVYACTSAEEVVDLLREGQCVFGIAVPAVVKELSGNISQFPSETVYDPSALYIDGAPSVYMEDELAARRAQRQRRSS